MAGLYRVSAVSAGTFVTCKVFFSCQFLSKVNDTLSHRNKKQPILQFIKLCKDKDTSAFVWYDTDNKFMYCRVNHFFNWQ